MATINEKIKRAEPGLTKKQLSIGRYVCDHIYDVALMNAAKIAKEVGVSEATLTRFVYAIGYNSFSDFQLALRKQVQKTKPNDPLRQIAPDGTDFPTYRDVFTLEKNLLDEALSSIAPECFEKFVGTLLDAEKVILVGGPTNHYIVEYFADYLCIFKRDVTVVHQMNMRFIGELGYVNDKTVAVIFTYARYPKEAIKIVDALYKMGVKILAVTDSHASPVMKYSSQTLVTPLKYILNIEPASCAMTLIHAILIEMYKKNKANIKNQLKNYESAIMLSDMFEWKDYDFTLKLD
ncbi:MAG: MurR/RpiR family transcriptional regulator [Synergistes jonesii]|uniref:MurR/RpiR family transcriptional regulator n=1 Tax=Synergistes jonesii TaxID=2754 RepID=UPI002A749C2F|nr:MurR/RpiR family transcriptional regulator [Synergistes jonesii]MDY2984916.1 MurR/RpiR family transcriptional regulator [Synergistes jonesii]